MQIPQQVEWIIERLQSHGYEAYAVGGCVRDTLLDRMPGDWDITTSARPEQVKELFHRTIDTGIQHGTVTILIDHVGYEVTTYRIDGEYEDGRHPKQVSFTSNLLEDLKRRDFTINAMAYSHDTGIVDAFEGMQDLEKRVIRCVGDPLERFTEDALRILRAIRFSAQLDFAIEEKTKVAIRVIAPNLTKVSKERIQVELTKLLLSEHPDKIKEVYESGIADYVSETFRRVPCLTSQEAENYLTQAAELPKEKYIRWAAFLRLVDPDSAVRILRDLKLDNDTIAKVKKLAEWSGRTVRADAKEVRHAMSSMDAEVWDALLLLNRYSDEICTLTEEIRQRGDCLRLKELAVTGKDLIASGVKPGKEIGKILDAMLQVVLDEPEKNRKETLMELLDNLTEIKEKPCTSKTDML